MLVTTQGLDRSLDNLLKYLVVLDIPVGQVPVSHAPETKMHHRSNYTKVINTIPVLLYRQLRHPGIAFTYLASSERHRRWRPGFRSGSFCFIDGLHHG